MKMGKIENEGGNDGPIVRIIIGLKQIQEASNKPTDVQITYLILCSNIVHKICNRHSPKGSFGLKS